MYFDLSKLYWIWGGVIVKKFWSKVLACAVVMTVLGSNSIAIYAKDQGALEIDHPLDVGMNPKKLHDIEIMMNTAIQAGEIPGGVILVTKDNKVVYHEAFGYAQLYDMGEKLENPRLMTEDAIFDLASVTKVMATTQAIMKLSYEGKLDVDDPVAKYIPDFAKNGKEKVKLSDLLTHTSGLTPWAPTWYYASNSQEELTYICNLPLEYETGTDRRYSDFSFMTLGFVVEAVAGMPLDQYVEETIYKPLGMTDTMYTPDIVLKDRIAATSWGNPYEYKMVADDNFGYLCEEDAENYKGWRDYTLVGEVNDGNTFYANQGVAGHAGLFSTANDLAKLGQLMLNGGTYNGVTLYDQETIDKFTSVQSEFGHGYGFEVNRGGENLGYMGIASTEHRFGHTGFTGTEIIFDKDQNMQVIILTNKQNLGVDQEGYYPGSFRLSRNIMDIVDASLKNANLNCDCYCYIHEHQDSSTK